MSREGKVIVSIAEIKRLLHLGYTRCVGDAGYHAAKGSIEQYYGLRKSEVKLLFKDERLRGLRVNLAPKQEFLIAEDLPEPTEAVEGTTSTTVNADF